MAGPNTWTLPGSGELGRGDELEYVRVRKCSEQRKNGTKEEREESKKRREQKREINMKNNNAVSIYIYIY
jgi:hypothetical protein